jgi:hypothetical protein
MVHERGCEESWPVSLDRVSRRFPANLVNASLNICIELVSKNVETAFLFNLVQRRGGSDESLVFWGQYLLS